MSVRAALALLATLAACAAPAREARVPDRAPPALEPLAGTAVPGVIGRVAGQDLTAEDLLRAWHEGAPREPWLLAERLVSARLALLEAARLGVRVDPARAAEALAEERARARAELERSAGGRPPEDFLREELGVEPEAWWAALERRTRERLTIERVVRAWTLAQPSRAVRLLAVLDAPGPPGAPGAGAAEGEAVQRVRRRLAAGEDFVALVRELSVDDSRERDGLVAYVVDDPRSALARVAFLTRPGSVGGPVRALGHALFLRVEEERAPLPGDWSAVGEAVEASLARDPLRDAEFVPWQLAVRRAHPVDLGPLEKLFGAP